MKLKLSTLERTCAWCMNSGEVKPGKHRRCQRNFTGVRSSELITGTGATIPVLASCRDLDFPDSRGVSMVLTDKRNEEQLYRLNEDLKQSHARFIEAQQLARIGNWEWYPVSDTITGSGEFYRLFDVTPERIAHVDQFIEHLHHDDRERTKQDIAAALHGARPYLTEYRVLLLDGGCRHIEARGQVFTDDRGAPCRMTGTCLDITERKQSEVALQQSETRFRSLADTSPLAIYMSTGIEQKAIYINPTFLCLFGYTFAEVSAADLWWPRAYPDAVYRRQVAELWQERIARAIATRTEIEPMETAVTCKDGSLKNILWRFKTIGEQNLAFGLDLTERRQAEQTLQMTLDELSRSNRDLEQFAYVASHDLQEPLRMVSSFTQLLACNYGEHLDQEARDYISFAVDGATRMQRLIQDLLAYSRVTSKGKPLTPLDSHDPLDEALANLQSSIQENGAQVATGELPLVMGDRGQLVQVFQNLIGNGIKFHRPEETPRIQVSAERTGDFWTFRVADNGIGIEPQYFDQVFQIFQRLHTRREYAGTGIGLAICKKTIERHGGRIWVESEPGRGTTFHLTLPAIPETKGGDR